MPDDLVVTQRYAIDRRPSLPQHLLARALRRYPAPSTLALATAVALWLLQRRRRTDPAIQVFVTSIRIDVSVSHGD